MAGSPRNAVRAYVRDGISEEFILRWKKLRDANDDLTNFKTLWTLAYAEHCANVYDEEQEARRVDQSQGTQKHVRALWLTLGIEHKATRSKIRVKGKWFKALPHPDRDRIFSRLPATKEAVYVAASYEGADLGGLLESHSLGPESTTSHLRALVDKATPQDRTRNAKRAALPAAPQAKLPAKRDAGRHRVTVICHTRKAVSALLAFVESQSTAYSIEAAPTRTDP